MGIPILQTKTAKTLLADHVHLHSTSKKNYTRKQGFQSVTAKIDGHLLITEKNFAHATTVLSQLYNARGKN